MLLLSREAATTALQYFTTTALAFLAALLLKSPRAVVTACASSDASAGPLFHPTPHTGKIRVLLGARLVF